MAGKLDLTEVEGLADLLAAETEQQRQQALHNAAGALRQAAAVWRQQLIRCMAHTEAVIDFGDDERLSEDVAAGVHQQVDALAADIRDSLRCGRGNELIRDGIKLALIGAPNAGKSSLLNYLADRDAAIVSPDAGTTRDVVTVALQLGGFKVEVQDTAGLRQGAASIEAEGMKRTLRAARASSIVVVVVDAAEATRSNGTVEAVHAMLHGVRSSAEQRQQMLVVLNKMDLIGRDEEAALRALDWAGLPTVRTSLIGRDGATELMAALEACVKRIMECVRWGRSTASGALVSRTRHRVLLQECCAALERYESVQHEHELAAEELRCAAHALGKLSGVIDPDAVLDVMFADFCIGK